MKPSQVATELRKIAAAIEASKTPDKARVASAIKGLVKKIATKTKIYDVKIEEGDVDFITAKCGGESHSAIFSTDELQNGVLENVVGDEDLLRDILMYWDGSNEFQYEVKIASKS